MTGARTRVAVVSGRPLIDAELCRMLADQETVLATPVHDIGAWSREHYDVVLVDLMAQQRMHPVPVERMLACGLPVVTIRETSVVVSEERCTLGARAVLPLCVTTGALVSALREAALRRPGPGPMASLSQRELDILALIASGLANAEIGAELFLSLNTVKSYIRTAYRKIGVHSRSQAILWAIDHDLLGRCPAPRTSTGQD